MFESGDAILHRSGVGGGEIDTRGDRDKIKYLSAKSRCRMLFALRTTKVKFKSMFTLSYGDVYPKNGRMVKTDLNRWLTWFRREYGRDVMYFWFLEFQKRGAPHVHVYISLHRCDLDQPRMAIEWALSVARRDMGARVKVYRVHSHTKQLTDFRTEDGYIRYATKYALKTEQKEVPDDFQDVGRFWGCSRRVIRDKVSEITVDMSQAEIELYLTETGHRVADWDILPKYVFNFVDV